MICEVDWLQSLVVGDAMKVRGVYLRSQLWISVNERKAFSPGGGGLIYETDGDARRLA